MKAKIAEFVKNKKAEEEANKKLLEMLEDDDEFEEFETHGNLQQIFLGYFSFLINVLFCCLDWEADENVENDYKWAVDWDDDLEGDNFISELRRELKQQSGIVVMTVNLIHLSYNFLCKVKNPENFSYVGEIHISEN